MGLRILVVAMAALVVCCSGKDTARECPSRAKALAAKARGLAKPTLLAWVRDELPTSKVARPVDGLGPVIIIGDRLMAFDGMRTEADGSGLARLHKTRAADLTKRYGPNPPIYIHAAAKTKLSRLVAALAAISKQPTLRLLAAQPRPGYRDPTADAPKRARSLLAELESLPPAEGAGRLAQEMERAIGKCPSIIELFGDAAGKDTKEKGPFLASRLEPALVGCECQLADLDLFEGLILATLDPGPTQHAQIPISLDQERGVVVELLGTATVGELVARIDAKAAEGITLRIADSSVKNTKQK